jgi:hypothetical protein
MHHRQSVCAIVIRRFSQREKELSKKIVWINLSTTSFLFFTQLLAKTDFFSEKIQECFAYRECTMDGDSPAGS